MLCFRSAIFVLGAPFLLANHYTYFVNTPQTQLLLSLHSATKHYNTHRTNMLLDRCRMTYIHVTSRNLTHNLSRRTAADLRLRPRDHWERQWSHRKKYDSRSSIQMCPVGINMKTAWLIPFWARSQNCEKASISFVISVCPSVYVEQLGSHWTDFHEIRYFSMFKKSDEIINFHQNLTRITGTLHEHTHTYIYIYIYIFWTYRTQFFLEWEMFQINVFEKTKTNVLCSISFSSGNRNAYDVIWKNMEGPDRPQKFLQCCYATEERHICTFLRYSES